MAKHLLTLILFALCACAAARPKAAVDVADIQGSARIQRAGDAWADLRRGDIAVSNDIIETGLQSRVSLVLGNGNLAVIGGATKVMVSVRGTGGRKGTVTAVSMTVFSGGALVAIVNPCSTSVFTAGAVVELSDGVVSVIADPVTSESGVQTVCGDNVVVRNVAQQRGRVLSHGLVSVVQAGAEPNAPSAITDAHVAVLKQLYGDSLVSLAVARCDVHPGTDPSGGAELPAGTRVVGAETDRASLARPTKYLPLFRPNELYGKILDDRARHFWFYRPVEARAPLHDGLFGVSAGGGAAVASRDAQVLVRVSPWVRWRFLDAALDLRIAENHERWSAQQFTGGIDGVLDLIDHVSAGSERDSLVVTIGRLNDYSIGTGLVVDEFTNRNPYSLYQPLALYGRALVWDVLCIDGFFGDITSFDYGGLHAQFASNGYYAGLGYFYDVNQYHGQSNANGRRFTSVEVAAPSGAREEIHIAELNLGMDLVSSPELQVRLTGDVAYRFASLTDAAGYVVRAPVLIGDWRGMQMGAGYCYEVGGLMPGEFNWMYTVNRMRQTDSVVVTQNSVLRRERETRGLYLFYRYLIRPGLAVDAEYHQDFLTRDVYENGRSHRDNFDYSLGVSINDTLFAPIHHARLSISQVNGGLYPADGAFNRAWGLRAGLRVVSSPIVYNIAAECSFDWYAIDLDFDDRVEPTDRVYEFYAGLRWGIK